MGIKNRKVQNKISVNKIEQRRCEIEQNGVVFSFQYITDDKDYNFHSKSFQNNNNIKKLFQTLKSMSSLTFDKLWGNDKKNNGFELIPIRQLKQSFVNGITLELDKDGSLYVMRCADKGRIILIRGKGCSRILYILGFDFSYTLYKH